MSKLTSRQWNNIMLFFISLMLMLFIIASPKPTAKQVLADIDLENIDSVSIQRHQQNRYDFTKKQGDWWLNKPFAYPANTQRLQQLLSIAKAETEQRYSLADLRLKEFGLQPAKAVLHINRQKLAFGNLAADNQQRYIQSNHELLLLEDRYYPLLNSGFGFFLDLHIIPANYNGNHIAAIKTEHFSLHSNHNNWLLSPNKPHISSHDIQRWLNTLLNAEAIYIEYKNQQINTKYLPLLEIIFTDGQVLHYHLFSHGNHTSLFNSQYALHFILDDFLLNQLITGPQNSE